VARIAEFLTGDGLQVIAYGFTSPLLKRIDENEIVDELRVILSEGERLTAYFTFSSQMRPSIHEFRIYGPANGLLLDQEHEILLKLPGDRFKSYADKFIPAGIFAKQYLGNVASNLKLFLKRDFHMDAGMKCLIESFYNSIREGAPLPIPYREILLTVRIMDSIFEQLANNTRQVQFASQSEAR
jgi:hypothetical protein